MAQTLARHVTELGRIRLGARVPIKGGKYAGEPRPERLKHFRLTSNSKASMEICARRYGGTVQAWTIPPAWKESVPPPEHTWELFTTSDTLDILFHPGGVMQTSWEEWQAGYCILRCNGRYIIKDGTGQRVGDPCRCPSDPQERKALAMKKPPEACEEISRIAVFLEGIPLGQWRLDTKGFYAPAEIRGLQDMMEACAVQDMLVRAQLRLEWRTDKKMVAGKASTLIYPCVVIEPRQSTDELLALGEQRLARRIQVTAEPKHLADHIADLCGDPDRTPAGERGAEFLPRIEALVAKTGGDLDRWRTWAEDQAGKPQVQFTVADYARWLQAVQVVASRGPRRLAQDPSTERAFLAAGGPPESTNAPTQGVQDPGRNLGDARGLKRDFPDPGSSPTPAGQGRRPPGTRQAPPPPAEAEDVPPPDDPDAPGGQTYVVDPETGVLLDAEGQDIHQEGPQQRAAHGDTLPNMAGPAPTIADAATGEVLPPQPGQPTLWQQEEANEPTRRA